ncbi:MAG: bifunctional pyr operon transcriptional regulator/uracil phosphoribosyltransferase PyrR, partial [Saprospiraceae bacterium]|nr:bifunctional pyr operon transcriptional regulator/uracil phosphoribosyltransferase PyrR [Saprospiraceae bacterium]
MQNGKNLLARERFRLTIERLCNQLIEDWGDFSEACVVGIQPRGVALSDRIYERLKVLTGNDQIPYGRLDITFYRDDFRRGDKVL